MEHVVFSAAASGAGEEFRRVSSLEEAVRVVEHLRNDLGITESSVFALTPVPLEFRTYYRVEVPGLANSSAVIDTPPAAEIPELRVGDLSELPLEEPVAEEVPALFPATLEAPELIEAVLAEVEPAEVELETPVAEVAEPELTDADFMPTFDSSDGSVPALLPPSSAIPPSREDADAEPSLGYFAR